MTLKLFSNRPSDGARNLAEALGIRRIRSDGNYVARRTDTIINWGNSTLPNRLLGVDTLNHPLRVHRSSNKLLFFQDMASAGNGAPRVPEWTTDRAVAATWFQRPRPDNSRVVCRTLLTSHSGRGIIIAQSENDLVAAPLYTRYVKKQAEYRVHILRGRIIDVQRKIRDPDRTPTDWQVRSHANGFIFVRNDVELPDDAATQSLAAFQASGLDFGAVDIIVDRNEQAYVLEINTAPGLTGTTVTNYADAFRREFVN